MQVQTLTSPSKDEFSRALESYRPSFVYLQGEYVEDDEVRSLVLDGIDYANPEVVVELFPASLPVTVSHIDISFVLLALKSHRDLVYSIKSDMTIPNFSHFTYPS